jgi:hypothetical protein
VEILLLIVAFGLQPVDPRWDFNSRIGLVRVVEGDQGCLAINADDLKQSDTIFAVSLEELPGRTFAASVQSSVESCPSLPGFDFGYRVTFHGDIPPATVLGAATGVYRVVGYTGGRQAFKLSPSPSPHVLHFESCSEEGRVRVRVLSDHPTPGTEVWLKLLPNLLLDVPRCAKVVRNAGQKSSDVASRSSGREGTRMTPSRSGLRTRKATRLRLANSSTSEGFPPECVTHLSSRSRVSSDMHQTFTSSAQKGNVLSNSTSHLPVHFWLEVRRTFWPIVCSITARNTDKSLGVALLGLVTWGASKPTAKTRGM